MLRIIYWTKKSTTMKVVLLAAGKGKRLSPITEKLPKQMIKIVGKPILEHIIQYLAKHNFDDICIIIGHQSEQIKKYFGDGSNFGVKITYVYQKEQKGTAHATYLSKNFVGQDNFLLYLADTIIPNDLNNFLQKTSKNFDIEILSSDVNKEKSNSVGTISYKGDGLVTEILEKNNVDGVVLAWAGIALFKSNKIFKTIEELQPSIREEYEITDAINNLIQNGSQVRHHRYFSFIDAGTVKGLLDLQKFLLKEKKSELQSSSIILSNTVYIGENCKFGKNLTIGPFVSIGNNVIIEDNIIIQNSIILDNSRIDSNTKIMDSILFNENQIQD
jgi:glucose-1-phosphate thymidylyltransferase